MTPTQDEITSTIIAERYQVGQCLRRSELQRLYKATDLTTNTAVHLKLLHPARPADANFREGFRRQFSRISAISHPNVLVPSDFGFVQDQPFLITPSFAGVTLREAVQMEGQFAPQRASDLAEQIADALGAGHAAGVVHGNISGHSIVLVGGFSDVEQAYVLDFGISHFFSADDSGSAMTENGKLLGDPEYLAPEQIRGLPTDAATDIYSLGIVLYEMLSGAVPFPKTLEGAEGVMDVLMRQANDAPAALDQGIERVEEISSALFAALQKEPSDRPQTVAMFIRRFAEASSGPSSDFSLPPSGDDFLFEEAVEAPQISDSAPGEYAHFSLDDTPSQQTPEIDFDLSSSSTDKVSESSHREESVGKNPFSESLNPQESNEFFKDPHSPQMSNFSSQTGQEHDSSVSQPDKPENVEATPTDQNFSAKQPPKDKPTMLLSDDWQQPDAEEAQPSTPSYEQSVDSDEREDTAMGKDTLGSSRPEKEEQNDAAVDWLQAVRQEEQEAHDPRFSQWETAGAGVDALDELDVSEDGGFPELTEDAGGGFPPATPSSATSKSSKKQKQSTSSRNSPLLRKLVLPLLGVGIVALVVIAVGLLMKRGESNSQQEMAEVDSAAFPGSDEELGSDDTSLGEALSKEIDPSAAANIDPLRSLPDTDSSSDPQEMKFGFVNLEDIILRSKSGRMLAEEYERAYRAVGSRSNKEMLKEELHNRMTDAVREIRLELERVVTQYALANGYALIVGKEGQPQSSLFVLDGLDAEAFANSKGSPTDISDEILTRYNELLE